MAINLTEAEAYFETSVLHNDEWVAANTATKTRALNNASNVLYRVYGCKYDGVNRPIPAEAIFEQALWLLRIDDTMKRTEQGYTSIMIDGIQLVLARIGRTVAPQALLILGRKIGRTTSGRVGNIVEKARYDEYGNRIV